VSALVAGFPNDLADVATAFSSMAAGYVASRIGKVLWGAFVDDLERMRSVTVSPREIWS
jgi:hypothetical protein